MELYNAFVLEELYVHTIVGCGVFQEGELCRVRLQYDLARIQTRLWGNVARRVYLFDY